MTLLGLAFLLGLILGGGVVVQAARSGNASWIMRGRGPGRGGGGGFSLSGVDRLHLNLDQAKKDSIGLIACRGMAAMDSIRAPIGPPMDSVYKTIRPAIDSLFQTIRPAVELRREQTRTEIRALLTVPQQQRYDSMIHAYDEQRKKMRDQGGPPSSGGGGGGGGPCSGSSGGQGPRGGFDRGPR